MKQKTLVILSPGFAANERDDTCLPAQQAFVRALKKVQPHLKVIILAFQYPYSADIYSWYDCEVHAFNGRNRGKWQRLLVWRKVWKRLEFIHRHHAVAGILSFWYGECCFIGHRFAQKHALQHHCWILGQDARAGNKYVKRMQAHPGELVAMSDFLAREFENNHGQHVAHIIPNGLYPIDRKAPGFRDIDVLGAGSLIPLKQYELFIDCIAAVRDVFPGVRAVLCGHGPVKEALQNRIAEHHLQSNIRLLGELPHDALLALMQRSKVLLHPSSYEGFSTVCLEALAAGAKVISFCRAMDAYIRHWHIVTSLGEMQGKLINLLKQDDEAGEEVVPYHMEDSARRMMGLFSQAKFKQLV